MWFHTLVLYITYSKGWTVCTRMEQVIELVHFKSMRGSDSDHACIFIISMINVKSNAYFELLGYVMFNSILWHAAANDITNNVQLYSMIVTGLPFFQEILQDMGITVMGDIIAILRHSKQVHAQVHQLCQFFLSVVDCFSQKQFYWTNLFSPELTLFILKFYQNEWSDYYS